MMPSELTRNEKVISSILIGGSTLRSDYGTLRSPTPPTSQAGRWQHVAVFRRVLPNADLLPSGTTCLLVRQFTDLSSIIEVSSKRRTSAGKVWEKMKSKRFGKRSAMIVGGVTAVAALTLAGALPANAATYVGAFTTTYFGTTEFTGHLSGYYARFSVHNDEGYDYASSAVHIKHISATSSVTHYGSYAAPGAWSYDALDYANVVVVGDAGYV
jgi:hypothetical protein